MENQSTTETQNQNSQLEKGTYEILRNRLLKHGEELRSQLNLLNTDRKQVFGSIDTSLVGTEKITTENNCIPVDMVSIGSHFIFGYNVIIGLKKEIQLADVFSVYAYNDHQFTRQQFTFIQDERFENDFKNLYKYYKKTQFLKFAVIGPYLFMVFKIGKGTGDIKTFKWALNDDHIEYIDNRSDHEFVFPDQHAFEWKRTTRDQHVKGEHPHISIEDKVFVETTEGDLTIKVENNTDSGQGIYAEPVENASQTLDDSEIYYALIDNIIVLKIRPYQEELYRYFVYNSKIKEAVRIDALEDACVLLPDNHGIIFANGYYLQTGVHKLFDNQLDDMVFEYSVASPNGEDYLYVFYNKTTGLYVLLSYNLIEQEVATPILCNGYTIFDNGEMCYFKSDNGAQKHHTLQIWKTPFMDPDFKMEAVDDSYLFKIGNKDIVRAMAECTEILNLINKEDSYENLYFDILKQSNDILDTYYWLDKDETYHLNQPLLLVKEAATSAIEEFEKVRQIKKNTAKELERVSGAVVALTKDLKSKKKNHINVYVDFLAEIRACRGEVISLKELRYMDLEKVEAFEKDLAEWNEKISSQCVEFLLQEEALAPYYEKVEGFKTEVEEITKVILANELDENIQKTSKELEMLIEVVSNLKIEDATETTRIIDNISAIYSNFNQINAALKRKRKELLSIEGKAEFSAQIKLISQGVINYLDLCDTPEKCTEYLTKLMVQLEELEGKFSEFTEFLEKINEKREEVYNSFESKKVALVEARNKKANALQQSAERILKSIHSHLSKFKTEAEINGYYASDLMVEKLRGIVADLLEMDDNVKADDIQSQLKTAKEEAIRQLKDKSELFVDGDNIIRFGKHQFTVNTQQLELSMVYKNKDMYYHLAGTDFFEKVTNQEFNDTKEVWEQTVVSENNKVYRVEYLVYKILYAEKDTQANEDLRKSVSELSALSEEELQNYIQKFMSVRYSEGYMKGVHDKDAYILLKEILHLMENADLLKYASKNRAYAQFAWKHYLSKEDKVLLDASLKGIGSVLEVFPDNKQFENTIAQLENKLKEAHRTECGIEGINWADVALYLFSERARSDEFIIDTEAMKMFEAFVTYLKAQKAMDKFAASIQSLENNVDLQFQLCVHWVKAFMGSQGLNDHSEYTEEVCNLLLSKQVNASQVISVSMKKELEGLQGTHDCIQDQKYFLNFNAFIQRLRAFEEDTVKRFERFTSMKKELIEQFAYDLRLEEFKPRVMSSFVRNKLIDEVYLPLIGNNLAKQMGSAGEGKRTDLMGMLLLISPPGYGKTTLMEYIANRLGIIFMKINGPALGHTVVSLDPSEAPNASAKEELEKLNLSFEMGNNVMIYVDDIQHCNPEFLQKFISLCDAQRKIEGVYKGRSKTYDFRGKKVCVVMAGNPYTESGDKFQIPDMLANRADIYNLGDILGDSEEVFNLSYIENSLTSNPILAKLAGKSQKDVYTMLKLAKSGDKNGMEFEANHSPTELNEYANILKKVIQVRDTVTVVNQEYIRSAAMADEYRTEPAFKLQGSYRNMNKMVEKIVSVMNEQELKTLILSHYESESQTLTTGAEANLLKFKELMNWLNEEELARWTQIKEVFMKQQKMKGFGGDNAIGRVIMEMESLNEGIDGIAEVLKR